MPPRQPLRRNVTSWTAPTRSTEEKIRVFTWTTAAPALNARYRLESGSGARPETRSGSGRGVVRVVRPSQRMREIGIVQNGAPLLAEAARPFDLPPDRETAQRCIDGLYDAMERIEQVHVCAKGMGLAAPQIGVGRAAAVVQPPGRDRPAIVLLNPRIAEQSQDVDEQYEGCLSFFDVRGLVPRPVSITVETTAFDGSTVTTVYERALARLVAHEIDHLNGLLYTARMRPGVEPIALSRVS